MNARIRRSLAVTLGLAGAMALPVAAAGTAFAADDQPTEGFPSTQSPTQGLTAGVATLDTAAYGLGDALNLGGPNREDGVNGTDTEFPQADPRFLEGPAGGLLVNGPFE